MLYLSPMKASGGEKIRGRKHLQAWAALIALGFYVCMVCVKTLTTATDQLVYVHVSDWVVC